VSASDGSQRGGETLALGADPMPEADPPRLRDHHVLVSSRPAMQLGQTYRGGSCCAGLRCAQGALSAEVDATQESVNAETSPPITERHLSRSRSLQRVLRLCKLELPAAISPGVPLSVAR